MHFFFFRTPCMHIEARFQSVEGTSYFQQSDPSMYFSDILSSCLCFRPLCRHLIRFFFWRSISSVRYVCRRVDWIHGVRPPSTFHRTKAEMLSFYLPTKRMEWTQRRRRRRSTFTINNGPRIGDVWRAATMSIENARFLTFCRKEEFNRPRVGFAGKHVVSGLTG